MPVNRQISDAPNAAFDVYQWVHGNRPANPNFTEVIEYITRNNIAIENDKMLITGRVCIESGLKSNDILVSESGLTFRLEKFYLYGAAMDAVCGGMTCAILTNLAEGRLFDGMWLFMEGHI